MWADTARTAVSAGAVIALDSRPDFLVWLGRARGRMLTPHARRLRRHALGHSRGRKPPPESTNLQGDDHARPGNYPSGFGASPPTRPAPARALRARTRG